MTSDADRRRIEHALAPLRDRVSSTRGLPRWLATRRLDRVRRRLERATEAGGPVAWPPESGLRRGPRR